MFNELVMVKEHAKYNTKYLHIKEKNIRSEYYNTEWVLTQGKPRRAIDSNNLTSVRTLEMVDFQQSRDGV
jgi:hypothetical protein